MKRLACALSVLPAAARTWVTGVIKYPIEYRSGHVAPCDAAFTPSWALTQLVSEGRRYDQDEGIETLLSGSGPGGDASAPQVTWPPRLRWDRPSALACLQGQL